MDYNDALLYIHSQNKFGIKLGLDNISALMESLGNPQNHLKFIHIAGTNGKGSTASMLSHAFCRCGYKTGLFISPFVVCFNERIQINNKYIPDVRLAQITNKVKLQIEKNLKEGIALPTEFELVTAIALVYFYEEKTDIIVFEVGMGGRLDATNVINTNLLSIITSISYDHKEHLGDSIEKIAYEKACIIKPDRPCVVMDQSNLVIDVIKNKAKSLNSDIYVASTDNFKVINSSYCGQKIIYKDEYEINLPLAGSYQVKNLSCVLRAIELLNSMNIKIDINKAIAGIEQTRFPGRFEAICDNPVIILDAAHNEEGVLMLCDNLSRFFLDKNIVLFIGKLKDKDFSYAFKNLLLNKQKIYTLTPPNERAMPSYELTNFIKNCYNIDTVNIDLDDILSCLDYNEKDTVYVFAGSIYLISSVRKLLKQIK